MENSEWLELSLVHGTYSFYRELDVDLLVRDSSPSWVMLVVNEENGVCGTSVWNSFHVPSNVSCFAYVEPLENFM